MLRIFAALLMCLFVTSGAIAQEGSTDPATSTVADSPAASSLADILLRQEGQKVDEADRRAATGDPTNAQPNTNQLGTLGGASDADLWRAFRFGEADISTQSRNPAATTLIQDSGMWWLHWRQGPLLTIGTYLMGGMLLLLAVFYLVRGKIRIDGEKTGVRIERFKAFERFGHWLLATSFIVLGLTGLISLFGRKVLIPAFGHEAFSFIAIGSKWVHNNVSWAFMIALIFIFFTWVMHNLPDRTDINWLLKGGGIFSKGHPPAKKFNAGQKLIFWSVIVLGTSISVSGLSLLFPFDLHLYGPSFEHLNAIGAPGWIGLEPLPTELTPHAEMQYAQLWHALVSLVLIAIIFAHIYIGTLGMEGAYDAMGSGQVEEQWAREHHSLWVEDVKAKQAAKSKEARS